MRRRTIDFGATPAQTIWIEKGERVYPCRCGAKHRGPYAAYDYARHNCSHGDLCKVPGLDDLICGDCGETFHVRELSEASR